MTFLLRTHFAILVLFITASAVQPCAAETIAAAQEEPKTQPFSSFEKSTFGKEPTYIKADSLRLSSKDQLFVYHGNVFVRQGDLTITADELEGRYTAKNEIESLTAVKNVVITKAALKATSQRAVYTSSSATVVLTEGPELWQKGSVLTADAVTIYLNENRSTADGTVRVKLIKESPETGPK